MYFAKNVADFPFNSWLSFQRLCRLLWGYLLDGTDAHQIINIKSKIRITYSTKQKNQKLFYVTTLHKQPIRKDFLWRLVKYSDSRYQCPRVLKLTQ